ncbi:hypothetical protein M413DRAFT_160177 [Hebeloma cylindrosporum]|uniref:Uncharacterized protein n=1 Tax=Hebeloma cylindrosporum TaxID=76867 RepID=A0A0C3CAE1_HEBCY|nr:hypothetical protein M413DRAFT_160177 [Hebeloma cylindrosporum h7]
MATNALMSQVAAKWQESFHRLNGEAPGISGLMKFSEAWAISLQFLYPVDIKNVPLNANGMPLGMPLCVY